MLYFIQLEITCARGQGVDDLKKEGRIYEKNPEG